MRHTHLVYATTIPAPAYLAQVRSKLRHNVSNVTHSLSRMPCNCKDYLELHEDPPLTRLFFYDCSPAPCTAEYTVKHLLAGSNNVCNGCLASNLRTKAESTCRSNSGQGCSQSRLICFFKQVDSASLSCPLASVQRRPGCHQAPVPPSFEQCSLSRSNYWFDMS